MTNITSNDIIKIIDNSHDELFIYDNNYNIIYVNKAVERHYGYKPNEMIGKTYFDFFNEKLWDTSVLPYVYKTKKPTAIKQTTKLNIELFTIAVPILDEFNEIEYVVMNVRDRTNEFKLLNPTYLYEKRNKTKINPIFKSQVMIELLALIERIAKTDATCILTGETGTGKTMIANLIHDISSRNNKPFISINCANISSELFESELFGYKPGAFTGANARGKIGLLSAANSGTLFFDEISELSLQNQAKLLTVLQDKKFIPVGGTSHESFDVRIITATNKDLKEMVRLKNFREDLYYRLNLIELYIPPLRNRKEEIPCLIEEFSKETFEKYSIYPKFSDETIELLTNHNWKGNIRELKHMVERLALTVDKSLIEPNDLPSDFFEINDDNCLNQLNLTGSLEDQIDEFKSIIVKNAYIKHNTSRKLAHHLKISQTTANNLIRKYIKKEEIYY